MPLTTNPTNIRIALGITYQTARQALGIPCSSLQVPDPLGLQQPHLFGGNPGDSAEVGSGPQASCCSPSSSSLLCRQGCSSRGWCGHPYSYASLTPVPSSPGSFCKKFQPKYPYSALFYCEHSSLHSCIAPNNLP